MKQVFIIYMTPWFEHYMPGHLVFQHEAESLEFAMSCWEEYLYRRFHEELWFAMDFAPLFPQQSPIDSALCLIDSQIHNAIPFKAGPATIID